MSLRADPHAAIVWRLLVVAEAYRAGIPPGYVLQISGEERRSNDLLWSRANGCRQLATYLACTTFGFSSRAVADVSDQSHQAVKRICHVIEDARDDRNFDEWLAAFEPLLKPEAVNA